MAIYINSEAAIVPQPEEISNWKSFLETELKDAFACIEPNYSEYLDPRAMRRMSRMMKMGLASALMCLKKDSLESPDAIITATGFGCLADTEAFLSKLSHEGGQLLNPTPFIQSTHNTVGGLIALHLKCHNYNNTFTQRGFSFESALTEASLLLAEKPGSHILLGAVDEMTHQVRDILQQFRRTRSSNDKMVRSGEGSTFFILRDVKTASSLSLSHFSTHFNTDTERLKTAYLDIINIHGTPDLILMGANGSSADEKNYQWLPDIHRTSPVLQYKEYCGEYPTAPGFAHSMACKILRQGYPGMTQPESILIYNQFEGRNHSFSLISKC